MADKSYNVESKSFRCLGHRDEGGERDMGHGEVTRDRIGRAEEFRLDLEVIQPLSDLDMICLFGWLI